MMDSSFRMKRHLSLLLCTQKERLHLTGQLALFPWAQQTPIPRAQVLRAQVLQQARID